MSFTPLTILVGPNGGGKSSILAALVSSILMVDRYASWDGGRISVARQHPPPWRAQLVQLDAKAARNANTVQAASLLAHDGSNLANVWATLPRAHQAKLAQQFCQLVPIFSDIDVRPTGSGQHELKFQDRWSRAWYGPHDVSDGSILALAFLVLTQSLSELDILAIEEPEHGIHPYLVHRVIELLREIATGAFERSVQIVIATQSPVVLDAAHPEEVRFVTRDGATGDTTVQAAPTEEPAWQAAYAEYAESLGDLWLSGGVGGVPGNP